MNTFRVYLSGEIHSDWREQIEKLSEQEDLDIIFLSPVTDHDASDAAGDFLSPESEGFWRDHKSAKVNAIRTRHLIQQSDFAVIRFGDRYKQWNAAFDAGYCAALDIPYITLHDESLIHPLKEVNAEAQAWTSSPEEVVELLKYVLR